MLDFIKKKGGFCIILFLLFQGSASSAPEKTSILKVSLLIFSVEQRNAFEELAALFNKRHPDIYIQYVSRDDADYKKNSALWLENPDGIDILNWPWPGRFDEYVGAGWIEPVSDLWQSQSMQLNYDQWAKDLVSVGEHQYAIPYTTGFWGFFYRESLFKELDITPPENWQDFLAACQILKNNQLTPIVIGTKSPWPTGGWFDFLNLRINGHEFHREVVRGRVSFLSERIQNVFVHWQQLIQKGYFNEGAIRVDIRQLLPLLYRRDAGMMLAGSYLTTQIPPSVRDDFKFFRFPIIDESVVIAEEIPTDMFLIPASSKNKAMAKKFLAFMSEAESQELINRVIHNLPVNQSAGVEQSYFLEAAQEALAKAGAYSQYFDRDAPYEFASAGLTIFARFVDDGDIKKAQEDLEQARQYHFLGKE
jgi:multiple sugar transport system substrate-binding protein